MTKKQSTPIFSNIPTLIPIPERILQIADKEQRRAAMKEHWLKYGYSDRFEVERIDNGHFVMVRKQTID